MINTLENSLINLRAKQPLILTLTNYVTMNFIANSLLSIGASPIMSESNEDIIELLNVTNAVYINIGTLEEKFIERAKFTCKLAKEKHIPIILDPVGAGASKIRANTAIELLPYMDIIRGNASEILAVYNRSNYGIGVDAKDSTESAKNAAKLLAKEKNLIVMISGADDYITDGNREKSLRFGSALMRLVVGMGCSLTAVIAAFKAVNIDSYQATIDAAVYFSLAGQISAENYQGIGSYQVRFLDNLSQADWKRMREIYE